VFIVGLSQYGNDYRVRLHHHPYDPGDPCQAECHEYSSQRTYLQRDATPRDKRRAIAGALNRALMDPAIGHVEFLSLTGMQESLIGRSW
jgi:hypothetical protein